MKKVSNRVYLGKLLNPFSSNKEKLKFLFGKHNPLGFEILFLFSILGFFHSCKKFVQIPPPTTQVVSSVVFNDDASATAAQVTIYSLMFNNAESWNMSQNMGLYADELANYATALPQVQLYRNALQAINAPGPWQASYYYYIYYANSVISGLQTSGGVDTATKQQLLGEAYFIRAFLHFYLTNIYGDMPLVLTIDYSVNSKLSRTPRLKVIQQVISDLNTAEGLLNNQFVDQTDTVGTTERVRPTKAAAQALLARVYLYLGDYSNQNLPDYQKADSAASQVINNNTFSLVALNGVFLQNSSEAIWQLQTTQPQQYIFSFDGANFILTSAPANYYYNSVTLSTQLLSSFEPNDQRLSTWVDSFSSGGNTWYFPYKYTNNGGHNGSVNTGTNEYTMVLRLAEQYLIRAEAEAHEGKTSNSVSDLNIIRTRAGLPNYAGPTDQASLLAAILHERQVELFTEWGHRWFDLVRTGNVNAVMSTVCPLKGGTWSTDDHQLLFPVPKSELSLDPNLVQNPEY